MFIGQDSYWGMLLGWVGRSLYRMWTKQIDFTPLWTFYNSCMPIAFFFCFWLTQVFSFTGGDRWAVGFNASYLKISTSQRYPPPTRCTGNPPKAFLLWCHVRVNPIYHTAYLYSIWLKYVPQVSFRAASSLRQVCFRSTSGLIQLCLRSSSDLCHICFRPAMYLLQVCCRLSDCFKFRWNRNCPR